MVQPIFTGLWVLFEATACGADWHRATSAKIQYTLHIYKTTGLPRHGKQCKKNHKYTDISQQDNLQLRLNFLSPIKHWNQCNHDCITELSFSIKPNQDTCELCHLKPWDYGSLEAPLTNFSNLPKLSAWIFYFWFTCAPINYLDQWAVPNKSQSLSTMVSFQSIVHNTSWSTHAALTQVIL